MKDAAVRSYFHRHNFIPLLRPWSGHHCARGLIQSLTSASGRCRFELGHRMLVICLLQCCTFTQPSPRFPERQSADITRTKARSSFTYAHQGDLTHASGLYQLHLRPPHPHLSRPRRRRCLVGDIISACEGKHPKQSCTVGGETCQCLDATVSVTSPAIPFLRRAN
jgi:hypothetical protein